MKVSVVIVSYNVKHFLHLTLESVLRQDLYKQGEVEIIVVDNNSPDQSAEYVKQHFPEVTLVANPDNPGFSKANNQGFALAKGKYMLILNPDTVLPEDNLSQCVQWMEDNPEVGAMGVRMLDGSGRFLPESKRGLPTPEAAFYKLFGLSKLFPRSQRFGRYHQSFLDEKEIHEVEVLAGAWILARKQAILDTGGFDEQYFMYGEDIDLSYRLQLKGWKVVYFPDSPIVHFKGESTRKESLRYVKLFYGAMVKFSNTHFSRQQASLFSLIIRMAVLFRATLAVLGRWLGVTIGPIMDAILIYGSFFLIKEGWQNYVRISDGIVYPSAYFLNVVPVYVVLWIAGAYFGGAYDKPWRASRHVRGILAGTLAISVIYAFLPIDLRYSRGLIVLGAIGAMTATIGFRALISLLSSGTFKLGERTPRRTLLLAPSNQVDRILSILQEAQSPNRYIGYLCAEPESKQDLFWLGKPEHLEKICEDFKIDELIFSAHALAYKNIIEYFDRLQGKGILFRFAPATTDIVLGSDSIHLPGDLYLPLHNLNLNTAQSRRNKRVADVGLSSLLILTFPLLWAMSKLRPSDFGALMEVLFGKKTLVGYSGSGKGLPKLKPGWRKTLRNAEYLETSALDRADLLYAKSYRLSEDWNRLLL